MCGITGIYSSNGAISTSNYYDAHLTIRHRGPDDEGFIASGGDRKIAAYKGDDTITYFQKLAHINSVDSAKYILGHRRLSIIDLSHHGHQPFISEDNRYSLAFNGEIFNYLELKKELTKLGQNFKTNTDTEVVLKAFQLWGIDCFNKFNGMWALAITDNTENKLYLCRDRFGIKPLYYNIAGNNITFASEQKFIKHLKRGQLTHNEKSIKKYLYNCTVNDNSNTFFNEISTVNPGSYLIFDNNGWNTHKYWRIESKILITNPEDALDLFSELFNDSIKLRMRSDVEVGTLLSGGLDSTTIVCKLHNEGLISGSNFNSFSAIFEEERFSEKKYIDATLAQTKISGHFVTPSADDVEEYLGRLLHHIEDPFRSLSVLSQFKIYEAIKHNSQIKVLLNGQGADELFGGYSHHYYYLFASLLKSLRFRKLSREITLLRQNRNISNLKILRQTILPIIQSLTNNPSFLKMNQREIEHSPLREYLKYDDRTSMAFGLEARVPFLDYRIVEFAQKLDPKFKIDHFENKKIVRGYAKDIIPKIVTERKDKMGFVSPQEVWQKTELKNTIDLVMNKIKANGFYSSVNVNSLMKTYKNYQEGTNNNWPYIWRNYCLYKWSELN